MNSERKGEYYIFAETFLWSLFPIFAILSFSTIGPLFALAATTFFSFIFFTFVVAYRRKWHELKNISALKDVLLTTLFLALLFYIFYFYGLRYTTAGNASLIALLETFTSFLFFNVLRKEHITKGQIVGAILMVIGAATILFPDSSFNFSLNIGDILVFIAMVMAPFGNFFQRRARKKISSETILFVRTLVATPIILLLAVLFGEKIDFGQLKGSLLFIVLNGVFLFGVSKILWVEAINLISVTKANALGGLAPLLTISFAFLILGEVPTLIQILSFVPLFVGLLLLTRQQPIPAETRLQV